MLPALSPGGHGGPTRPAGGLAPSSSAPLLRPRVSEATARKLGLQEAFLERQLAHGSVQARRGVAARHRELVAQRRAEEAAGLVGEGGALGFRKYLKKKFGSIVAAWRVLDSAGNGRLTFPEFCNACRKIGYIRNLKQLWFELDKDRNNFISVWEIDPEVGHTVGTFKLQLLKRYGNMLTAWTDGLDVNGSGRIEEREVEACCRRLGLSVDPTKLYGMLRAPSGGVGLTLKEFDPDAYVRWRTSDFKGLMTSKAKIHESEDLPAADLDLGTDGGAPPRPDPRAWRRELVRRDAEEVQAAAQETVQLRLGLHTVPGFRRALVQRCGSLFSAWRECLDLDESGRLTFGEFCQGLRRLGFHGDVKQLWQQLDVTGNGYIEFRDLDPETDALLNAFREKLIAEHGNVLLAWIRIIDIHGNGSVREDEFVEACEHVGFSGDAPRRLFHLMKPEAGRSSLSLWDLDPKAWLALSRGDYRLLVEEDAVPQSRPGSPQTPGSARSPTEMNFLERSNSSYFFQRERAREASLKEEFAKVCREPQQHNPQVHSTEDFEHLCCRRYGSVVAAWRRCLDVDHIGKLSFPQFCTSCRRLGYDGNLKALWAKYDTGKQGFVSLADLDKQSHVMITNFFALLAERYQDLNAAWADGFKKDPAQGKANEEELGELCRSLGYTHDPGKLFRCLQPSPEMKTLCILDLRPLFLLAQQARAGRAPRPRGAAPAAEAAQTGGAAASAATGEAAPRPAVEPRAGAGEAAQPGGLAREDLLRALCRTHGSSAAAWRGSLDPEGRGFITFAQFCAALQDSGAHGSLRQLWRALAQGQSSLAFKDVDPDAQQLLEKARRAFLDKFGSLSSAWHQGVDAGGLGRIDKADFTDALNTLGIPGLNPHGLFRLLLARAGQRSLILGDFRALLIGLPGPERAAAWGGEDHAERPPWSPVPATASPREQADEVRRLLDSQELSVNSLLEFKQLLVGKFGSLFAAWMRCLDPTRHGTLTERDFCRACRGLGVERVQQVWRSLDVRRRGLIRLEQLDAETATAIEELEKLLVEKHGQTKDGWRQVFDPGNIRRCDRTRFVAGCTALGYSGDAEQFFELLAPDPNRKYLTYGDLWHDVNPNEYPPKGTVPSLSPKQSREQDSELILDS